MPKPRALMAATLLFLAAAVSAQRAPRLEERLSAIEAFGIRAEGSAAEAAAFDYIEQSLRASGLETSRSGFSDAREGYSTSRIVEARAEGRRQDELAVVVPVSSWADSSDPAEGAFGLALALDEAERIALDGRAGSRSPISLRFVFLGAENRGKRAQGSAAALGSSTWIARMTDQSRLAVLYLSLDRAPSWIAIHSAGRGVLSPFWLYDVARKAMEGSGIGVSLDSNRLQAYRLGLAGDFGPAAPFLEAGIPALELHGEGAQPLRHGPGGKDPSRGTPANEVAAPSESSGDYSSGDYSSPWFANFIRSFASGASEGFGLTWDRHYFIIQIGRFSAVLREKLYVALMVASFALVALSFLLATIARRKAAKQLFRRVPLVAAEILALFVALALVFLAGKGIAKIDALVLGSDQAWSLFPRLFAAARILFCFLFFLSLLSFLVENKTLTPNPHFYEFAALVCLAVDALVFSAADLSASFYFIWALVLVEISLAVRRRWATLMAYLLMYVPLIVIAAELAARPDLSSYGRLIAPGYLGVLALSALTLPFFVFTASPLLFFARPGAAARKKAVAVFAVCAIAVEGFALAYAAVSAPLEGQGRRDLRVSERMDQDKGQFVIELSGLRRLGRGSLDRGGEKLEYLSLGDSTLLRGEDRKEWIGKREGSAPFLDRMDESVAILFAEAPYSVDIALESAKDLLIYDCSLPYKVAVDGKSAVIYAGVNPGKELDLSLTVPASFRSRLVVTAHYLHALDSYSQSSGASLEDAGLAVKASFDIGSSGP